LKILIDKFDRYMNLLFGNVCINFPQILIDRSFVFLRDFLWGGAEKHTNCAWTPECR